MGVEVLTSWSDVEAVVSGHAELFPRSALRYSQIPYYQAIARVDGVNRSFLVVENGKPQALAISISTTDSFTFFDTPSLIEFSYSNHDSGSRAIVTRAIAKHISTSNRADGESHKFSLLPFGSPVDALVRKLLELGAIHSVRYEASVDLRQDRESLWKSIRSGHKQSITKGRQAFGEVEMHFGAVPESVFSSFQALHLAVSGRVTRHADSWEQMKVALEAGHASLATVRLQGEMVGATFCWVSAGMFSYGTGAYRRDLFTIAPISHLPLFTSIEFAKERNRQLFVLGDGFVPIGTQKEQNIASFKRGFTKQIDLVHVFEIPSAE